MKKVLIVDHDLSVLSILAEGLKRYDVFEVVTTESVKLAAKLLNILKIDVVITELWMPEIDGFKLLAYVKKKYPSVSVIVMTSDSSLQVRDRLNEMELAGFFEKPVNIELLAESLLKELNIVPEGRIQGISLASFLQLVDIEAKTCTLTIKSADRIGHIYALNGDLIGAATGALKGKDALYQILSWDKTTIEIEDICRQETREIDLPLMHLLMESQMSKDETRYEPHPPSVQKPLTVSSPKNSAHLDDVNEALFEMKTDELTVDGLDESNAAKEEADKAIAEIIQHIDGVYEYYIANGHDHRITGASEFGLIPEIRLSEYLSEANRLKHLFHVGSLRYMVISTRRGIRYCLYSHEPYQMIAAMEPGFRPVDFIKKVQKML